MVDRPAKTQQSPGTIRKAANVSTGANLKNDADSLAALADWTRFGMTLPEKLRAEIVEWITYDHHITMRIIERTAKRLGKSDRQLLQQYGPLEVPGSDAQNRITKAFDSVLVEQAGALGPRIFVSRIVLSRVHAWFKTESYGPERLEKLLKQFVSGSQVRRGDKALHVLPAELYSTKKRLMGELRPFFRLIYEQLNQTRRVLPREQLLRMLREHVLNHPQSYPTLFANWSSMAHYLEARRDDSLQLCERIALRKAKAADIADGWLGFVTGHAPSTARKIVSKLGSRKAVQ
jgi:hypothetical protein